MDVRGRVEDEHPLVTSLERAPGRLRGERFISFTRLGKFHPPRQSCEVPHDRRRRLGIDRPHNVKSSRLTVGELCRQLTLPHSAKTGQRDYGVVLQRILQSLQLALATREVGTPDHWD